MERLAQIIENVTDSERFVRALKKNGYANDNFTGRELSLSEVRTKVIRENVIRLLNEGYFVGQWTFLRAIDGSEAPQELLIRPR